MRLRLDSEVIEVDIIGRGVWYGTVLLGTLKHRRFGAGTERKAWVARSMLSGITYVTDSQSEAVEDLVEDARPLLQLLVLHNVRPGTELAV